MKKQQPPQPQDIPGPELAKQLGCCPYQISDAKYQQRAKLQEGKHWYRAKRGNYSTQTWVMWTPLGQEFMKAHFDRKRKWHKKRAEKSEFCSTLAVE